MKDSSEVVSKGQTEGTQMGPDGHKWDLMDTKGRDGRTSKTRGK